MSDLEYAVMYPRVDDKIPWRIPPQEEIEKDGGKAWAEAWVAESVEDGFNPGVFQVWGRPAGPWAPVVESQRDKLPKAYGFCTCSCHQIPGVYHIAACCHPEVDS